MTLLTHLRMMKTCLKILNSLLPDIHYIPRQVGHWAKKEQIFTSARPNCCQVGGLILCWINPFQD